ncbi:hypothetical protein PENSPDRAFT_605190 [Peniophora sp. CONT]|nr:hypothetical protein PENSPDRAFT_605190 [Peniophora sp. CONT]
MMRQSRTFMRARAIAFCSIAFLAFVWTTLLIVLLSLRWAVSSKTDRAFIVAFLIMDLITVFILPILLLCRFRPWLDAARLSFLLIFHFSLAGVFASQFEGITCTDHSLDGPGVCALFNTLLLMASWVIPVLLAIYGVILAWYAHRNRNFLHSESDRDSDDETVVSSDFGGKEKRETISTFNDRARKVESYQPWRPYSATSPTKPSLTITIPPPTVNPNLPSVEPTATTSATAYDDRRSPFAPRPSPSATRGRRSSSSTFVPSAKRPQSQPPSARSQQKPARPRSQPPASRNRRQTMPSPLSLHDGDRIKTGAELATQKRQSAGARKNSLPSSNLQLLSVEHALPGRQFGSLPSRGRRASSSMSAGSTGASPANQFATWGWSVPAARPGLVSHAKSNSSSSRSPTSTVSGSLKHDSIVSSRRPSAQLLAVDSFESGKGRLVKQPDIAL